MKNSFEKFKESAFFFFCIKNIPLLVTLAAIFIEIAPVRFSYFSFIRPQITLVFIFLISVYFPENLGYFRSFALGLFSDLLGNSLPGLNAFLFLLIYVVISKYKNYLATRPFVFVWLIFISVSFVAAILKTVLTAIADDGFPPLCQILISYAMLGVIYLGIAPLCNKLNIYMVEKNINAK